MNSSDLTPDSAPYPLEPVGLIAQYRRVVWRRVRQLLGWLLLLVVLVLVVFVLPPVVVAALSQPSSNLAELVMNVLLVLHRPALLVVLLLLGVPFTLLSVIRVVTTCWGLAVAVKDLQFVKHGHGPRRTGGVS